MPPDGPQERTAPVIRAVRDADVPEISAIYGHYVRTALATFETDPPDAAEMARRLRLVAERGLPFLVAEREGCVAGYAYAAPYRPRPAYRPNTERAWAGFSSAS
jgi:phosphinothricin acetyltransferase